MSHGQNVPRDKTSYTNYQVFENTDNRYLPSAQLPTLTTLLSPASYPYYSYLPLLPTPLLLLGPSSDVIWRGYPYNSSPDAYPYNCSSPAAYPFTPVGPEL